MKFHRIVCISFFLLLVTPCLKAQDPPSVKASVSTNRILIGELFQLTIEAVIPGNQTVLFPRIDSIEHFEFLSKPVIDSSGTRIRKVYSMTSFDSGHWLIPSFVLSGAAKTDTIPIDVVFSAFDPNQPYHDIKDIIEVEPAEKKQWWLYVAGGAVLLVILLFILFRKKRPVEVSKAEVTVNAYEEALQQLAELQRGKADTKQYYSRLADIFRLYLFRKKGILSLQKTTDDLVTQLKGLNLPGDQFNRLSQSLRLSDFVKFAKYVPSTEDDRIAFEDISVSIKLIEQSGS